MKSTTTAYLLVFVTIVSAWLAATSNCQTTNPPTSFVLSNAANFSDSQGNKYTVGYDQVSSINQDAFVKKETADGTQVWKHIYDSTPTDSRGILVVVDTQDRPWVAFSNDGGSTASGTFSKKHVASGAFTDVVASGYGQGGGPKVTVLARLNPDSGLIEKGTYLTAILTSGNTNTFNSKWIGFSAASNQVVIYGQSAAWPVTTGTRLIRNTTLTNDDRVDGSFICRYVLNFDLSEIVEADGTATMPTTAADGGSQPAGVPSSTPGSGGGTTTTTPAPVPSAASSSQALLFAVYFVTFAIALLY